MEGSNKWPTDDMERWATHWQWRRQFVASRSVTDAFEMRQRAIESHRRMRQVVGTPVGKSAGWETLVDWKDDALLLETVPTHWWPRATAALVTTAAKSYPLTAPIHAPITFQSFSVFEEPCLWVKDDKGNEAPLSALLWAIVRRYKTGTLDLCLRGYGADGRICLPFFWVSVENPLALEREVPANMLEETDRFQRWVLAASTFLEQKILRSTSSLPCRQSRKRAERLGLTDKTVETVYLRDVDYVEHSHGPVTPTDVDWQYRWWVKGHWRQQWFPVKGEHFPKWIEPHVKGPETRPFKPALERVYAVTR